MPGDRFYRQTFDKRLNRPGTSRLYFNKKTGRNRTKNTSFVLWQKNGARPEKDLTDIDVWINLAGKSLFGRWNEKTKAEIATSRLRSVEESARIIQSLQKKPNTLIQASAVGIYGTSLEQTFTEESPVSAEDF